MAETPGRSLAAPLNALVVCNDAEMSAELRAYLERAGVCARATCRLGEAWMPRNEEAIVLLPDDFDTGQVTDGLSVLFARSRNARVIIVTAEPRLFEPLLQSWESPESVVIMPKPVWGWTILDLLRGWSGALA